MKCICSCVEMLNISCFYISAVVNIFLIGPYDTNNGNYAMMLYV